MNEQETTPAFRVGDHVAVIDEGMYETEKLDTGVVVAENHPYYFIRFDTPIQGELTEFLWKHGRQLMAVRLEDVRCTAIVLQANVPDASGTMFSEDALRSVAEQLKDYGFYYKDGSLRLTTDIAFLHVGE